MNIEKELHNHFEEDKVNFKKINDNLDLIMEGQQRIHGFMDSLSWLSDISKATDLLKRPSLWFVAFVLGLVALFGGIKALILSIASLIMPK